MGAFKIQTDLDLSGFNLLNFCIQSYTDLENVPNLGLGRKLFFTGNSTDEKNLREVIWNGVEWKAAVYLDDIEALTNGEGSLGTRVKALEDMLKMDDANDVINTWAEIQEFLDQVQEGTDLMTMLDGKLDKTGGTMELPSLGSLKINCGYSNYKYSLIEYRNNGEHLGRLGFGDVNTPVFMTVAGIPRVLLHEGNYSDLIGDTYLKTTGGTISSGEWAKQLVLNNNNSGAAGLRFHMNDEMMGILYMSSSHKLFFHDGTTPNLEVLHEGNVGDYTAGAAKKLEKPILLWGNFFDGTQSLSEHIIMSVGKELKFKNDNSSISALVLSSTSENFMIGFGTNEEERTINTYLDGYKIYFRTGAKRTAMTITEEGNVVINTSNSLSRKLAVGAGGIFLYARASSVALGEHADDTVLIGSGAYGMQLWADSSTAASNIQAMNYGGTATAYALNLNPLGGAVNVGEGGLNVTGGIKGKAIGLGDDTTIGAIYLSNPSVNYIWASKAGGSIHLGVKDTGSTSSVNSTLSIYKDHVRSGNRTEAVSLGLAGYRWSNIYSTLGNFSDTVTIGKTGDGAEILRFNIERPWSFYQRATGGNTTLELKPSSIGKNFYISNPDGSVVFDFYCNGDESSIRSNALHQFNGGALIPTGQTLTIGSVTFRETAEGEVEVDGNLHATGTLASGGKATVGEGDNGGGGNANVYSDVLEGVITQEWEVGNPFQKEDVIVSLYMWNTDESRWEMVLADIGVTSENIWVTFGRPTSTTDKYMAVVMG